MVEGRRARYHGGRFRRCGFWGLNIGPAMDPQREPHKAGRVVIANFDPMAPTDQRWFEPSTLIFLSR
jgi:hypothetical protein